MRILISTLGSVGDFDPFLRLAVALRELGHDPRLHANEAYASRAAAVGIPYTVTGTADQLRTFKEDPASRDTRSGLTRVAEGTCAAIPAAIERLTAQVEPGNTLLVASTFAFAPRLMAEAHGLPLAVVHLSPANIRSEYEAPKVLPVGHMTGWPRAFKRGLWRMMDKRFIDPTFGVPLNRQRAALGLPPIERPFHHWLHQGHAMLGLFPSWFAQAQPDWPGNAHIVGFPLPTGPRPALDPTLDTWLSSGSAPVVFTSGTALAATQDYAAAVTETCDRLGIRGLIIGSDVKGDRTSNVLHWPAAPFESLLPRAAAIQHHGGIGTTAQAMEAGIPQLISPVAFDQLDNASRAQRLGVAYELPPKQFNVSRLLSKLSRLLDDASVRQACQTVQARAQADDGARNGAQVLDTLVRTMR